MRFTILGVMSEVTEGKDGRLEVIPCNDVRSNLKTVSGKNAGVCYMKESYFNSNVTDTEKANKRCDNTWISGHHSISGHERVKVLLEGIPKALAMVLNNLQNYDTSEKSGRYTEMVGSTDIEKQLYEKWCNKLNGVLEELIPEIPEAKRNKIALENARMMLSIFTPTTMIYTTSVREWNYIVDWVERYKVDFESKEKTDFEKVFAFDEKLIESMEWLVSEIKASQIYFEQLRDTKNYKFHTYHESFMFDVEGDFECETTEEQGNIRLFLHSLNAQSNMIVVRDTASFAMLAQLQRHRTGRVQMWVDTVDDEALNFYIPVFLLTNEKYNYLCDEWLNDMDSLCKAHILPIGYLVKFAYTVALDKSVLMFKERVCGAAQVEIRYFARAVLGALSEMAKNNLLECDEDTAAFLKRATNDKGELTYRKCCDTQCKNKCIEMSERVEGI